MLIASDHHAMQLALEEARAAGARGEVPVGAVVVKGGEVIARAGNSPVSSHDPSAHAEMLALRAAAQRLGNYRLDGCEVFITLEPCAMCASALLQARVKRVVYGAAEPKTGAAGSVLNLFAEPRLNHHTCVERGLLANDSGELLASFFASRRAEQRSVPAAQRLRDDALRTLDAAFEALPSGPWSARYISTLPSLNGLRMHHVDTAADSPDVAQSPAVVCLHGVDSWSYVFREVMADLAAQGVRVLALDLVGFGRSDKPKKVSFHTPSWHQQVLWEWVEHLALGQILWLEPANRRTGLLDALTEPFAERLAERSVGRVILPPGVAAWRVHDSADDAARMAPYVDAGHRAGPKGLATWPQVETPMTPCGQLVAEVMPQELTAAELTQRLIGKLRLATSKSI